MKSKIINCPQIKHFNVKNSGSGSDELVPGEMQPLPSQSWSYKLAVEQKKIKKK